MTKAISAGMTTHLAQDTTRLTTCIELTLESGPIFRFSDHPADIVFSEASGTTTGADDPILLIDSTAAFQTNGIEVGAAVTNTTDGSTGTVVSIDSQIQITTSALTGGTEDDWDTGDAYTITGVTFLASVGHQTSDPVARNNLAVDGLEMQLLLDNPGLLEGDLLAGLYDYADYKLFMLNYETPAALGDIKLMKGKLGEVSSSRGVTATVELRGLTQNLQKMIGEKYSPDCPVELTDPRCGVELDPTDWDAAGVRAVDDRVSPTTANGRQFISTRIGKSGGSEPTWNTVIGGLTTEPDTSAGTTTAVVDSTTTGADHATLLIDSTALFQTWGVAIGDAVRNPLDGPAGGSIATVASIDSETQVTTTVLLEGLNNTWELGDTYEIDLTLVVFDSAATFITDGVVVGSTILNTTDGSTGTVLTIDAEERITVAFNVETEIGMAGGTDNLFQTGDAYQVKGAQWRTIDALTKDGTVSSFVDAQNFTASNVGVIDTGTATSILNSTTTGADDPIILIDSTATFLTNNVTVGDVIRNTTDGSAALVDSIESEIQLTSSALVGGAEDDWDTGDAYEIDTATVLNDSAATFITTGVSIGDILSNTTDGSEAIIVAINSETQLTTATLAGGTLNVYVVSDAYSIAESHTKVAGTHDGDSGSASLVDSTATFVVDGVTAGDFIINTTDGSSAVITTFNETQINTTALINGVDNDWDAGDAYLVERPANGADSWQYGEVTWVTGANAGLVMEVKQNTITGVIELFLPMAFAIANGDTFKITAGCDKLFKTCRVKFDNVVNFQGFPYVPTPDTLMKIGGQDSGRLKPEFGS